MKDKILRKIFLYLFGKYIEESRLKINSLHDSLTKNLRLEIKDYFEDFLDDHKSRIQQLIKINLIRNGIEKMAEEEINKRGLVCAIDFGTHGENTQVIIIGNHRGKHYVNSWSMKCDNVNDLKRKIDDINKKEYNIQRVFIDSPLNIEIGLGKENT